MMKKKLIYDMDNSNQLDPSSEITNITQLDWRQYRDACPTERARVLVIALRVTISSPHMNQHKEKQSIVRRKTTANLAEQKTICQKRSQFHTFYNGDKSGMCSPPQ